jgi:hypothetical protein
MEKNRGLAILLAKFQAADLNNVNMVKNMTKESTS